MTPAETIRTALAKLWNTGANAYELAQAVMQNADIENADLEIEVESVIARALLAREFADLSKVAEAVAKVLPGEAAAGEPAVPLCEAIVAEIRSLDSVELWVRLRDAEGLIRKHFAALSVEVIEAEIEKYDHLVGGSGTAAQAVLRLLRKG